MKLKIGNSVRVKDGVMDGEFPEFALGGYQGRIADISKDDTGMVLISVEWDSLSLRQLPNSYIEQSIEAELDWSINVFGDDQLEIVTPRDKEVDVEHALADLESLHWWDGLEYKTQICSVLDGCDPADDEECGKAWHQHLSQQLILPTKMIMSEEAVAVGKYKPNSLISVVSLHDYDSLGGIMVGTEDGTEIPLCDLLPLENAPQNQVELLLSYTEWFFHSY